MKKNKKNIKNNFSPLEHCIVKFLKKNLLRPRYFHSVGVMRTAEKIAQQYGASPCKARLAGLLHDCSRGYSIKKITALARQYNNKIHADKILLKNPSLLHGYASAVIAKKQFNITDHVVLQAMARHTIAGAHMSMLDKIIYLADITAPDRRFKELKILRILAQRNIDVAMRAALYVKIKHVLQKKLMLHPGAVSAWNEFIAQKNAL